MGGGGRRIIGRHGGIGGDYGENKAKWIVQKVERMGKTILASTYFLDAVSSFGPPLGFLLD